MLTIVYFATHAEVTISRPNAVNVLLIDRLPGERLGCFGDRVELEAALWCLRNAVSVSTKAYEWRNAA